MSSKKVDGEGEEKASPEDGAYEEPDEEVEGMKAGEKKTFDVPPAEAFGEKNPMMGPVDLPGDAAPPGLQVHRKP